MTEMKTEGFGLAKGKQKIKNLRSTFNEESKKSGAGLIDDYVPILKCSSSLIW